MMNPQYHLRIHPEKNKHQSYDGIPGGSKASVVLAAQGSKDIPLNLTVVWSQGGRIVE
jgi:calpain-7